MPWRARCVETRTPGSTSGPQKRTGGNADTALRADSTRGALMRAILPVTADMGSVRAGDVLVDNFNNKSNNQGTGTTIVDVHPDKSVSVFAALPQNLPGCPGGVGLTTAMVALKDG